MTKIIPFPSVLGAGGAATPGAFPGGSSTAGSLAPLRLEADRKRPPRPWDDRVDEESEDSFPASDPPSFTPGTPGRPSEGSGESDDEAGDEKRRSGGR